MSLQKQSTPKDPQKWEGRIYLQSNIIHLTSKLRGHKGMTPSEGPTGGQTTSMDVSRGQAFLRTDTTAVGLCPRTENYNQKE